MELINILCNKANEGITVRLLYDDVGSNLSSKAKSQLANSKVEHNAFMPVLFSNSTGKFNYRDHRKIIVVDGAIGYVGGINLEQKYDNSYTNDRYWRDTHLRIQGAAIGSLQSLFLLGWNFASKNELKIEKSFFPKIKPTNLSPKAVQIVASGPDSDWANIMEAIFCAVTMAKEKIYITTPYFMPNNSVLTALTTASRSGVDVKVIIPYESDSWAAQYASDSYVEQCLASGIRIFRYTKGFVHAKTMLVDSSFTTIGTANLDYRSFTINFEVNALIYDTPINEQMTTIFEVDLKECEEVKLERWNERGIARKLKESVSRLLAPLL